ncbi:MAG: dockerin type I domain-containing protein, partial [Pirellulaceae bacterium]|nr:dockerin type I domain-containing protein [Pirellulaceae bacterium]
GAYAIGGLVAGQYFVEAVSPSGRVLADSRREVTLAEGEALGSVDLVAQAGAVSWQNPVRPTDVNGDGEVTALDALVVINYINAHNGDVSLPADDLPPPYLDVDGNGLVTAADVLAVINHLNNAATSSSGAGGESAGVSFAEGESPNAGGLALSSPSFAASLTAAPTRAAGDADHGTGMARFDHPSVGDGAVPSRVHHWAPAAEFPAPVRAAATSGYVIKACKRTVPHSPPEVLAGDEMSGDADLEDLLSVLAEDLSQSRAGSL